MTLNLLELMNEEPLIFTENEIRLLKKSPIFNFSLSSKELFHSNFFAWLLNDLSTEENGEVLTNLFWSLICGKLSLAPEYTEYSIPSIRFDEKNNQHNNILREKNNTDLQFEITNNNDKKRIIIENKVKSLPNLEQLENYIRDTLKPNKSKNIPKADDYIFILLTLHEPAEIMSDGRKIKFDNDDKLDNIHWHVLNYCDIIEILGLFIENEKCQSYIISNDKYKAYVIKDYIELIKALIKIDDKSGINIETERFDWSRNSFYKQLFPLRIADFYLKKKYSSLFTIIYKRLGSKENQLPTISEGDCWLAKNKKKCIYISTGFSYAMGLVQVKYKFESDMWLGIQIQGDQFRIFVEGFKESKPEKLAEELNNQNWFDFSKIFPDGIVYPKSDKKELNSFSGVFWYKNVKIPPTTTISDLIDKIEILVNKFHRDIKKIEDLYNKIKVVN
jgi:hypothetical protein